MKRPTPDEVEGALSTLARCVCDHEDMCDNVEGQDLLRELMEYLEDRGLYGFTLER